MYALFCDHVRNNKELVLAAVVLSIPRHYLRDRDIVRAALKEDGNLIHLFKQDPVLLFYANILKS